MPYIGKTNAYRHQFPPPITAKAPWLYIGSDPVHGWHGVPLRRHAITIAESRCGKFVGLIAQNLRYWRGSALVIDPKGEAAEETFLFRSVKGQDVGILDPFHHAQVAQRWRVRINPLRLIDLNSRRSHADIRILADALVMRHDPRAAHWDGGGVDIIAGAIAFMLEKAPPEKQNLSELRTLLTSRDFKPKAENISRDLVNEHGVEKVRRSIIEHMLATTAYGNLAAAAAAKIINSGRETDHFISVALTATKWLDDPAIAEMLSGDDFDLRWLKERKATLYLVLPPDLLVTYGGFLRLFVQMALSVMTRTGDKGEECLFILDEFHALGYMEEIRKAAGLMAGAGVHLWPFLQNLPQLSELYGEDGAHSFIGSADAAIFFGVNDLKTARLVSDMIGPITSTDLGVTYPAMATNPLPPPSMTTNFEALPAPAAPAQTAPPMAPSQNAGVMETLVYHVAVGMRDSEQRAYAWDVEQYNYKVADLHAREKRERAEFENQRLFYDLTDRQVMRDYEYNKALFSYIQSFIGRPRVAPDEVMRMTARVDELSVSANVIYFHLGTAYRCDLTPHFSDKHYMQEKHAYAARLMESCVSAVMLFAEALSTDERKSYVKDKQNDLYLTFGKHIGMDEESCYPVPVTTQAP